MLHQFILTGLYKKYNLTVKIENWVEITLKIGQKLIKSRSNI